jgi:hypothetical protein
MGVLPFARPQLNILILCIVEDLQGGIDITEGRVAVRAVLNEVSEVVESSQVSEDFGCNIGRAGDQCDMSAHEFLILSTSPLGKVLDPGTEMLEAYDPLERSKTLIVFVLADEDPRPFKEMVSPTFHDTVHDVGANGDFWLIIGEIPPVG